jgi:hypothetical protein
VTRKVQFERIVPYTKHLSDSENVHLELPAQNGTVSVITSSITDKLQLLNNSTNPSVPCPSFKRYGWKFLSKHIMLLKLLIVLKLSQNYILEISDIYFGK